MEETASYVQKASEMLIEYLPSVLLAIVHLDCRVLDYWPYH